jgi:hypothetical protein
MCGWCKCWLIILAPSNPLVQGRWASCGSLMEEVPLPSGNALGTSGLSCYWHFSTISFLVTWVGSPLQGLLGIQFFRGLLCVVKEQRKKISTLTVTLSLGVSLSISISFGLELCWGLADNLLPLLGYVVYLTQMMIQLGLVHYCRWIQQPLLSLFWDGLFWQRIDIKGGQEQSSALWASQNNVMMPIALLQKYLWWCPYMGSPAPTQESSSVVHLPH